MKKDFRNSDTPSILQKSSSVHEHLRIHANPKFDKNTYLLNQIKLRSITLWKKPK